MPEWRTAYVDYKQLKKLLKAVLDSLDEFTTSASLSSLATGDTGLSAPPSPRSNSLRQHTAGATAAGGGSPPSSLVRLNSSLRRSFRGSGGSWTGGSVRDSGGNKIGSGPSLASSSGRRGAVIHVELVALATEHAENSSSGTLRVPSTHVDERTPQAGRTAALGELRAFWAALDEEVSKVSQFVDLHSRLFEQRFEDIMSALRRHRDFVSAARRRHEAALAAAERGGGDGDGILEEEEEEPVLKRTGAFVSDVQRQQQAGGVSSAVRHHHHASGDSGGSLRRRVSDSGGGSGTGDSPVGVASASSARDDDDDNGKLRAPYPAAAGSTPAGSPSTDFFVLQAPSDGAANGSGVHPHSSTAHHGVHFSLGGGIEVSLGDSDTESINDLEHGDSNASAMSTDGAAAAAVGGGVDVPLRHGVAAVMAMHHTSGGGGGFDASRAETPPPPPYDATAHQAAPAEHVVDAAVSVQSTVDASLQPRGGLLNTLHLPHLPHLGLPHVPHMHVPHVKLADGAVAKRDGRQLRRALTECYRGVLLLSSFIRLNQTAVHKIIKKHDKLTAYACEAVYLAALERCNWTAVLLTCDALCKGIEREFEALEQCLAEEQWKAAPRTEGAHADGGGDGTEHVAHQVLKSLGELFGTLPHDAATQKRISRRKARHAALSKLRPPQPRTPGSGTLLGAGFAAGGCVAAAVNVAVLWTRAASSPVTGPRAAALLPVLRGPMLLTLHMFLHGCAVAVWSGSRISHAFIFGSIPGTEMAFPEYLLLAGCLTAGWLISWAGILTRLLATSDGDSQNIADATGLAPFVILLAAALFFCVPLPSRLPQWPPRTSRSFFSEILVRTLTAPLWTVRLPHLFLADQFTSQIPAACDLLYAVAWFTSGAYARGDGDAFKLSAQARLTVALIPAWLRIAQCLRRYRDEGARLHVVNTGKYATSAAASVMRYLRDVRFGPTPTWTGIAILTALASSVYSFLWDVRMDWGLGRVASRHMMLRNTLMLGRTIKQPQRLYVAIIFVNALLRLTWLIQLCAPPNIGASVAAATTLAALEVMRRCMWNVLRIENEHVANMEHYRATANVPLPKIHRSGTEASRRTSSAELRGKASDAVLIRSASSAGSVPGGLVTQIEDAALEMQPLVAADSLSDHMADSAAFERDQMSTRPRRAPGFAANAVMPHDWGVPLPRQRGVGDDVIAEEDAENDGGDENADSTTTWDRVGISLALLGTGARPPPASRRPRLSSVFEENQGRRGSTDSGGDAPGGAQSPRLSPSAGHPFARQPSRLTVRSASLSSPTVAAQSRGEHFDWRDDDRQGDSSSESDTGGADD